MSGVAGKIYADFNFYRQHDAGRLMAGLYNRVKMSTATTGTGTITLGSAASNAFLTFAEAGVPNAKQVRYVIEEGNDFEMGLGTYTSSGTTFSRDTVTVSKIGGTAGTTKMTLAGAATVKIDLAAEDVANGSGFKVVTFTFDTSLSTNFSVTGVGFKPRSMIAMGAIIGTAGAFSWGFTDGTTTGEIHGRGSVQTDGMSAVSANVMYFQSNGTDDNQVGFVSFDTDGFTLSRTKDGSQTGTATCRAICFW